MSEEKLMRERVPEPPSRWERFRWYGPGLLWMISSVGSGSVLFTPRVGSRYEYALLWAALVVIFLMWIMIREVGRYTVVTGRTILDAFNDLPGPRGWAVWLILVPQFVAAVVTISGIAALVGSALMIALPGSQALYAVGLMLGSAFLVFSGRYQGVERASSLMSGALILVTVITVFAVFPDTSVLATGLVPALPTDFDIGFILPWLGFILAGAAGILWFSYWVAARGYGGETKHVQVETEVNLDERADRLQDWLRVMSTTAAIGVVGGGLIIVSFLILGAELLGPEGVVPSGIDVAEDLTLLLSEVWGVFGFWLLIIGIVIALSGTIVANQDGWPRMLADATIILLRSGKRTDSEGSTRMRGMLLDRDRVRNIYLLIVVTLLPIIVFFVVRNPVDILSVGGIVAAAHTPVVVFLTLYVNKRQLPSRLQPGMLSTIAMVLAGGFFSVFAVLHFLSLLGVAAL